MLKSEDGILQPFFGMEDSVLLIQQLASPFEHGPMHRTEPSPKVRHVDLHGTKTWYVAWAVDHADSWRDLEEIA